MSKKISIGLAISLMAISAAITFIISTSYSMSLYNSLIADVQQRAEMYTKLEQIDTYVRSYYDGTIDEDQLIESLARSYISVLGSNQAVYRNAQETAAFQEQRSGVHLGIGVYTQEVGGFPSVTRVLDSSPAASVGIREGDSIVEINGESTQDMGYVRAYSMLTAEAGTTMTLTIRSGGEDRRLEITSVQINIASVQTRVFDSVGYIRITDFNEKTYQQFMSSYSSLATTDSITSLIIDLRNNSGVIHEPVFNLLNSILPEGSVPYVMTDMSGEITEGEPCEGGSEAGIPIAVLVNSKSSGPAELFSASLRDSLGARIVGTTTAGNAKFLETYSLYDSTAISLPIATLSGVSTGYDSIGIKPDYEVQPSSDSQSEGASSDESDPCIKKAMEILSQQR